MSRRVKTSASYEDCEKFFNIFDSPKSFSEFIKNTPQTASGKRYGYVQRYGNKDWFGTESWDEAEKLLVNGDIENMKKINVAAVAKEITGGGVEKKNTFRNSPVGFLPIVPNVLSGHTDNMLSIRRQVTSSTKILNICYDCAVPYFVTTEDMIKTAAMVASVIRGLEKNGYRVNLFIAGTGKNHTQAIGAAVKVKSAGEYLDMLRLAYPIVNPSFFRRHFLAHMERVKGYKLMKQYALKPDVSFSKKVITDMFKGKDIKFLDFEMCNGKNTSEIVDLLTSGK